MGEINRNISKKTRFEVFKRDSFTCQYCGRKAPDVILEIDHINPISNGGNNDIVNLITACFDCNRGKGKKLLTQKDEIIKQQKELEALNKRREQLEMIVQWKQELENLDNDMVNKIEALFKDITGCDFSNVGKNNCLKAINKYGFEEVYESTKIALDQYYNPDDNTSIEKAFNYIIKICFNRKQQQNNPNLYKINYLCKIGKNRFNYFNEQRMRIYLIKVFDTYSNAEDLFDYIKPIFCTSKNWSVLRTTLEEEFGGSV